LTTGVESDVVDNTTNKYLDYRMTRRVRTGTSPTVDKTIELWVIPILDGTTYPDAFDGTNSGESVVSRDILFAYGRLGASVRTDATTGRDYWLDIPSVAALFDGFLPEKFVLWVTHDTGVALDGTEGNHVGYARGRYETI
jgi:hypothetical protein